MKRPDTIIIEGRAYSWRVILELRRAQLEAWKAAQPQPASAIRPQDRLPPENRAHRRRALPRADLAGLPARRGGVISAASLLLGNANGIDGSAWRCVKSIRSVPGQQGTRTDG